MAREKCHLIFGNTKKVLLGFTNKLRDVSDCNCDPERSLGTCDNTGQCQCISASFGSKTCASCSEGLLGENCDVCGEEYIMENGVCVETSCYELGTKERLENGTCVCLNGYSLPDCFNCEVKFERNSNGLCRGVKFLLTFGRYSENTGIMDMSRGIQPCPVISTRGKVIQVTTVYRI